MVQKLAPLNIVTIGGGTGSFTLLKTFKEHFEHVTAIVNMADNGGSTGALRDELGVLPPGDIRQCLVALSESPRVRDLFTYRFNEGSLKGQSLGNIFLSAAEKVSPRYSDAVELAAEVLRIRGQVIPVTTDNSHLLLDWGDGSEPVRGEFTIGHLDFKGKRGPHMSLTPPSRLNPHAADALRGADIVVIAPGNLYGSLAPALIVDGMQEVLASLKAPVLYVCNLVTKPGQTTGFAVGDFADEIERLAGGPILTHVLYNDIQPGRNLTEKYVRDGEFLVEPDDSFEGKHYQAISLPLIDLDDVSEDDPSDAIAGTRSLIRHDAVTVADFIRQLFE